MIGAASRFRPDRILVGEIHEGEAAVAIAQMRWAGTPWISTMHANSPAQVAQRMMIMWLMGAPDQDKVRAGETVCGLDIVIHLTRRKAGREQKREIEQVAQIVGDSEGAAVCIPLWQRRDGVLVRVNATLPPPMR